MSRDHLPNARAPAQLVSEERFSLHYSGEEDDEEDGYEVNDGAEDAGFGAAQANARAAQAWHAAQARAAAAAAPHRALPQAARAQAPVPDMISREVSPL